MGVLATDNFNRADGVLSGNWTRVTGAGMTDAAILSNAVVSNVVSNAALSLYTAITWPDNQYAQCAVIACITGVSRQVGVILRGTTADRTNYQINLLGPLGASTPYEIRRFNAGVTTLLKNGTVSMVSGDILKGSAFGSTLTIYVNGTQIDSVVDGSPIASGTAGLVVFYSAGVSTSAEIDDWEGGSLDPAGSDSSSLGASDVVEPVRVTLSIQESG